ncbi:hypothetical protein RHSP_68713 [Rhizobium freirei PRF 81]|uniref:Uncharacterized protein n=1 Tax=Rhizobium freirei PRF 81 TaxID=363754 RepID=N6USM0_9HYPH|nr:hypothetical protein [Rhizobium freirei]ENN84690.1 hypothetical protein RHSP_68713 [Rhizobium freirei PRF 81]
MSEIQNRAVTLVMQKEGDLAPQSSSYRSTRFLKSALDLYFSLGGDEDMAAALVSKARRTKNLRVDAAVANLMIEVAVASHLSDMDMIQATYNRIDAELGTESRRR